MKILCFGDSNTYGYDPRSCFGGRYDAAHRWVDLLTEHSGWTVINAGENGREIPRREGELLRFSQLLRKVQPIDMLLLMLGSNDLLQGASVPEITLRMGIFLSQIPLDKHKIVLIAPPSMKWGEWVTNERLIMDSRRLADAYQKVSEEAGIYFLNTEGWKIEFTFDGVHFSPKGHRTFAEQLRPILESIHQEMHL